MYRPQPIEPITPRIRIKPWSPADGTRCLRRNRRDDHIHHPDPHKPPHRRDPRDAPEVAVTADTHTHDPGHANSKPQTAPTARRTPPRAPPPRTTPASEPTTLPPVAAGRDQRGPEPPGPPAHQRPDPARRRRRALRRKPRDRTIRPQARRRSAVAAPCRVSADA